jgi:hypothetical protein
VRMSVAMGNVTRARTVPVRKAAGSASAACRCGWPAAHARAPWPHSSL